MDRIAAIRDRLQQALAPERLEIVDESHLHAGHAGAASGGGHFAITIVSGLFSDTAALERHRMIYRALGDLMPAAIHALSIHALTPEEDTSAPNT
jgi:BolA protein